MPPGRGFFAYLLATTVVSGAAVMIIEVLGSRVIGPFFGVSLFVWTSLITVTLIALACGYALGGIAADRHGSPDVLYAIVFLAGLTLLLLPYGKSAVLKACLPLGLRAGSFASALLLFGLPLFLLGCVAPYLAKIATREMGKLGRTVGGLYALSTLGSVFGTLLTGFFLIGHLGIGRIYFATGALLIGMAVIYAAFFRKRWQALGLLVLPLLAPAPPAVTEALMASGTRAELIARLQSFYGQLKVVDYRYRDRHTRELLIDGLIQGGIDMQSGLSIYGYAYALQMIPYALNPRGRDCLVLGLGAGIVPQWYAARGIRTDVLDIDPQIVQLAKHYFGFSTNGEVWIADARQFLTNTSRRYDYIILDVFNGDSTPSHILSVEALRLFKMRMNEGAVLAGNIAGSLAGKSFMTASIARTLESVFDQVEVYPLFNPEQGGGIGNLILIAYDGPRRNADLTPLRVSPIHALARPEVDSLLRQRALLLDPGAPAIVLSDDFNPIDVHDAWLREAIRKNILANSDWDILINSD